MDLVDKQNRAWLEIREDADQVSRAFDGRSARDVDRRFHLDRNDVRDRRLSQTWRAVEQEMIKRLVALQSGAQKHAHVFLELGLPDELGKSPRTQRKLDGGVARHFVRL